MDESLPHSLTTPLVSLSQPHPEPYISPAASLSFESKRIVRQAQDPNSSSRIAHYLYEVIKLFKYAY